MGDVVKPPDPQPPNRIERETQGSAENAWMVSRGGVFVFVVSVATAVVAAVSGIHAFGAAKAAAVTGMVCGVNWIRHRRFADRARWIRETPNWWQRMDEAPTLLTFPRAVRALRRVVHHGKQRRYNYE